MITLIGATNKTTVSSENEFLASFIFDKIAEITNLPTTTYENVGNVAIHSMALCVESGKVYSLDSDRDWVLMGGQ